jgi:hypothetical protein
VLVQDATMPQSNDLPAAIAKLARRNAIELRDSSWEYDVGKLGDAVESIIQSQAPANQVVQLPVQQLQPSQQMASLVSQLVLMDLLKDWDAMIEIGKQVLKIEPNHELTRSKTAEA